MYNFISLDNYNCIRISHNCTVGVKKQVHKELSRSIIMDITIFLHVSIYLATINTHQYMAIALYIILATYV